MKVADFDIFNLQWVLSGRNPTINRGTSVTTSHNFRNTTLISYKRKVIDILNSSGQVMPLLKP